MRALFVTGLLLTTPCFALDWKEFNDPKAFLLTDAFAKGIAALGEAERNDAKRELAESLKAPHVEVRRRAALTLNALGDKAGAPVMIADLNTATGSDRNNVIVALRILKDERSIPALRAALKDNSPYIRSIALGALGEMKVIQAYDEIVALVKDKEDEHPGPLNCTRQYPAQMACYALGALGDSRAIPVLMEALDDAELRPSAQQALGVLTKQEFKNDTEKWKAWWKAQKR